jgi:hypothetical protein
LLKLIGPEDVISRKIPPLTGVPAAGVVAVVVLVWVVLVVDEVDVVDVSLPQADNKRVKTNRIAKETNNIFFIFPPLIFSIVPGDTYK